MNFFSSLLNMFEEILIGMLKINERKKHADDEKDNLSESLRRINSSSQDGTELEICGNVNCVEEVHSRKRINHFPSSYGQKRRTADMTGTAASRLAAFGFALCSLSLKYSKPVLQAQPPHSLWLSIIALLSFTLFACATTVMLLVGARFTHMQIIVMLIAFFNLVLA
ncbi:hypothetical protein DEO72_LG8g2864 [Vigna unguiculata]|uniref:PGG domain-containing protein n=1 Tax=Vigna unguiculata TaxID=3917 RepID=A0A4D6MTS5_VIGUN|nr:hypothetical protein DEO72_LG8g2864 [Vigna unguiculata]